MPFVLQLDSHEGGRVVRIYKRRGRVTLPLETMSFLFIVNRWMFSTTWILSVLVLWENSGSNQQCRCNSGTSYYNLCVCVQLAPGHASLCLCEREEDQKSGVRGSFRESGDEGTEGGRGLKRYSCFSSLSCCSSSIWYRLAFPLSNTHTLTRSTALHCSVLWVKDKIINLS